MPARIAKAWREQRELERKRQRLSRIRMSTLWFRTIWLAIFALRVLVLMNLAALSFGHWFMASPIVESMRNAYNLPTSGELYTISGVLLAGAAVYAQQLVQMVHYSVKQRRLAFRPQYVQAPAPAMTQSRTIASAPHILWTSVCSLYTNVFGPRGLLGIEHPYFFELMAMREIVEIGLQSYQTYTTTTLVPRRWISDLSAALLVLNCWSTLLVRALGPKTSLSTQRVLCLAVDMALDVGWSVVVPICIVMPYVLAYDPQRRAFPDALMGDHSWQLSWEMEIQQLCFTTWLDLASSMLPCASILSSSRTIAGMLDEKRIAVHPQQRPAPPRLVKRDAIKRIGLNRLNTRRPAKTASITTAVAPAQPSRDSSRIQSRTRNPPVRRKRSWLSRWMRSLLDSHTLLFFTAGVAVVAIHTFATVVANQHQSSTSCLVQMRPWFTREFACAYANINCYAARVRQRRDLSIATTVDTTIDIDALEITTRLASFQRQTLRYLVIAHATELTMPAAVAAFPNLRKLEVFNATLVDWPLAAALTMYKHPVLRRFSLVYTNLTMLPAGVTYNPAPFVFVDLIATNLTTLPDAVVSTWRSVKYLHIEHGVLHKLPPAAAAMSSLERLSVCDNAITELPRTLSGAYSILSFAHNPARALPESIRDASRLRDLSFEHTRVTELPSWVSTKLAAQSASVAASTSSLSSTFTVWGKGSALCEQQALTQMQSLNASSSSSLATDVVCTTSSWRVDGYFRFALVVQNQPPAVPPS